MSGLRIEHWRDGDGDRDALARLRYEVLVEEMGKYRDQADHGRRLLVDDEDRRGWHTVAIADDGAIAAAHRLSWGGNGFSDRQREQYDLDSWLDAGLVDHMIVGERTMVAPAHRGTPVLQELMAAHHPGLADTGPVAVFGACEPHLLSLYVAMGQVPYARRNINSPEAGYLIPMVSLLPHADAMRGLGTAAEGELPEPVAAVIAGGSSVMSSAVADADAYFEIVRTTLDKLEDARPSLFDDLADDEVQRCLERSNVIDCAYGDTVLKAGGTGRNIFVVLDGTLEVRAGTRPVAVLRAGDAFGETAFLLDVPRTADIVAVTPGCRVLSLSDGAIRSMIDEEPAVAAKVLLNISRMLCGRLITD